MQDKRRVTDLALILHIRCLQLALAGQNQAVHVDGHEIMVRFDGLAQKICVELGTRSTVFGVQLLAEGVYDNDQRAKVTLGRGVYEDLNNIAVNKGCRAARRDGQLIRRRITTA